MVIVAAYEDFPQLCFRYARPFQFSQPEIGFSYVEGFGVERAAQPFLHGPVLRVFPVLEDFDQVFIAPNTTAIFRRTSTRAVEAERGRGGSRIGRQDFVRRDLMLPGIAEVVFVAE